MDILKLLSRSTKSTNKSNVASAGKPLNLPSAGTSVNPQLYNDPVPQSRGTKRKRVERTVDAADLLPSNEEVNFFAGTTEKTKKKSKTNTTLQLARAPSQVSKTVSEITQLLLEEECRQTLRSHRLKLTLLPSKYESAQKSKKSKNRKVADEATKKNKKKEKGEPKQLFPQPLLEFEDLQSTYGISKRLGENLASQGYKIPTEVQMGSLPLLLRPDVALSASPESLPNGEVDLLAIAPTGSGKTLAFLIPVVNSMIQRRREKRGDGHCLDAIVVAPTKELASQIVNEGRKLAMGTGIKVVGMQKGMRVVEEDSGIVDAASEGSSSSEEEDDEETPKAGTKASRRASQPTVKADIIVTTPLILLHALSAGPGKNNFPLPSVRHLVLDEADILLDPLFREQTLGIWEACVNPGLHVTLWSATMGSNIEALALETIETRRSRLSLLESSPVVRLVVGLKDSAIPNISHRLTYAASEAGKLIAIRQLLHPTSGASTSSSEAPLRPPFLVFTQTIPRAIALHSELLYDIPIEAGGSTRLAVLHSDLSDSARSAIMTRFRNGEIWVLITTDILSRGVDFRGINGVVNYDVPNSGASYIHRVGRTGRAGRDGGVAVTFYTKEDIPYVKNVANIIAASEKQAGKTGGLQKWLLDALPTPSKKEKKDLKMHGVEARRTGLSKEKGGKGKAQISTKSGYERKMENRKKGAIQGSKTGRLLTLLRRIRPRKVSGAGLTIDVMHSESTSAHYHDQLISYLWPHDYIPCIKSSRFWNAVSFISYRRIRGFVLGYVNYDNCPTLPMKMGS